MPSVFEKEVFYGFSHHPAASLQASMFALKKWRFA